MKKIFPFLFFISFSCLAKEKLKLYILAGQSNMSGTYNPLVSELPTDLNKEINNVLIAVGGEVNYSLEKLVPGLGATTSNFGPEITFGKDASVNNEITAILKYSYGATTLNEDWRPPSSGGQIGWLYTGLINFVRSKITSLDSNYIVEIDGMCWMQGEYDALDVSKANNYEYNLINLIKDVRNDLSANMPFTIGMIDTDWPFSSAVRIAELSVPNRLNQINIFDTHGLPTLNGHYNTQGQIELGHLFYSSFTIQNQSIDNSKLWPNPANTIVNITYPALIADYPYKIINNIGQEVSSGKLFAGKEINISSISSGNYTILISINASKTISQHFVKL